MTRITGADQILLLLQAHLERTGRLRRGERAARPQSTAARARDALARAQSVARNAAAPGDVARLLVTALLAEEFGPDLANDARFQAMVDDVLRVIGADEDAKALLDAAAEQLLLAP